MEKITELKNCKRELKMMNKQIQILPHGYLGKKRKFYYHALNGKEIGITKDPELISQLCRKRFLLARKEQITNNISTITQFINSIDKSTPKELIRNLPNAYQDLPISYFFHPSVADWIDAPYEKNPHPLQEPGFESKNGIIFRSKSEYSIGNQLDGYDIPYRYDAEITLGKQKIYANFLIKNPFNGELYIWEHLGTLNHLGDIEEMNEKINLYMEHGYIPFDTLIYTFEVDVNDDSRLQNLIEDIIFR